MDRIAKGEKPDAATLNRLVARVSDLNLPKPTLSSSERVSSAFGYWVDHHVDAERKLNFRTTLDKAQGSPDKLRDVKGLLTPLLRDSMVGLAYAYYTPPGAQVLFTNPMFVRSHDFIGLQSIAQTWRSTEVVGAGWPSNAGGRLVGSLAGLPYAPRGSGAELPDPVARAGSHLGRTWYRKMLVGSKSERWWNVTPSQVRWVALHTRLGESVLVEAALDAASRDQAIAVLERYAPPARARRVEAALAGGDVAMALEQVTPSELYLADFRHPHNTSIPAVFLEAEIRAPGRGRTEAVQRRGHLRGLRDAQADPDPLLRAAVVETCGPSRR